MNLMTPEGGTLFWTAVTFVALLVILTKVAWKPILRMLDERERTIKESLEKAEKAKIEAEKTLASQSEILESARKEAQDIIAHARKSAQEAKEEIVVKARSEADQLLQKAKREIELSRDKAIEEIRDLSVDLAMTATQKLIGKTLNKEDHRKIIQESLSELGDLN
jgi:F-type H+-transporting ATPase subunit b